MDLFGQYIAENELQELTVLLEKSLRKTGKFAITDRAGIQAVMDEFGVTQKDCRTVPWLVRIGKKLMVDKVVIGSVNKLGRTMTVHIRTIDVAQQQIDKSATEVCQDCSVDDIYIKKMPFLAQKLAGLIKSDAVISDSLFSFSVGPLVELDERKSAAGLSKQTSDKLFEDWRRPAFMRRYKVGLFLYTIGASLLAMNNVLWAIMKRPPDSENRIPLVCIEEAVAFAALPLLGNVRRSSFKDEYNLSFDGDGRAVDKGFKAGVAIARLNPNTYNLGELYKTRAGISTGLFLTFSMSQLLAFQTELFFVQRGFTSEGEYPENGKVRMNYLELPLLLKARLPLKSRFTPNVIFGLSPSLLLNASDKYEDLQGNIQTENLDDVSRFDIGLVYGLEGTWYLTKGNLGVELRNIEGLFDLGNGTRIGEKQKNRAVAVNIGYYF